MASGFTNKFIQSLGDKEIDLNVDTFKVMLLDNTYVFDRDLHEFEEDVDGDEVVGTGYVAGGMNIASTSYTRSDPNDNSVFDGDDVSWTSSTITARFAAIIWVSGTDTAATNIVVYVFDFGSDFSSSNTEFKLQWDANGIFTQQEAP